jgi:phosphatidate cytidylyltransferase
MPIVPDVPAYGGDQDDDRGAARLGGPLFREQPPRTRPYDTSQARPSEAAQQNPEPMHDSPQPAPPPQKKSAGRDLGAAIGVAVGLGVVIVASLFVVKAVFVGVVAVAVVVGLWELTKRLEERKGIKAPLVPLALGGAAMVVAGYARGAEGAWAAMALTSLAVLVWRMTEPPEGYLKDVTAGVFAAFYVPFLATFVAMMLTADDGPWRRQRHRRVCRRLALRHTQARPAHQPRQDPRGPARRGELRDGGGRAVHAVPHRRRHLVAGPAPGPRGRGHRHAR